MIEVVGDLWSVAADARCVTTNGVVRHQRLVMGAGVALEARRRYPLLPFLLGQHVRANSNVPAYIAQYAVISFPTKHHWRDRADPGLIAQSAGLVVALADAHDLRTVALPRPGCGCGGLDWSEVRPLLAASLDDRFIVVADAAT